MNRWLLITLGLIVSLLCTASVQAASVTLTLSQSGTVHCNVVGQATFTNGQNESRSDTAPPYFYVINSSGANVGFPIGSPSKSGAGTTTFNWQTLNLPNGTYTVYVRYTYINSDNDDVFVDSSTITVVIKNGYQLSSDAAKTYAKVIAPVNNSTFYGLDYLTINTDHKITWERFDDCGNYTVYYGWARSTTANSNLHDRDPLSGTYSYVLPKQIGEFSKSKLGWQGQWQVLGIRGQYTADAYTFDDSGNVAHGSNAFNLANSQ